MLNVNRARDFIAGSRAGVVACVYLYSPNESMKLRSYFTSLGLVCLLLATGCASTRISDRDRADFGQLPVPNNIWVYDFAASAGDVTAGSALYGQIGEHNSPQTDEQLARGSQVGAELASELTSQIAAMGLPAKLADADSHPGVGDIVIRGYIIAIVKGDRDERVAIGLGEGDSELKAAVEVFEVTANGLQKLGGGDTNATGNKTPGAGVGLISMLATHNPLGLIVSSGMKVYDEKSGEATISGRIKQTATEIAGLLKKQFQHQDWID
jgi:hypothetical protein